MTFDEPVQIVNYSSGDELAYETSFATPRKRAAAT